MYCCKVAMVAYCWSFEFMKIAGSFFLLTAIVSQVACVMRQSHRDSDYLV